MTATMKKNGEQGEAAVGTWAWHRQMAPRTASYPNVGANPLYLINGLVGELGEVIQLIKKVERNDLGVLKPERRQAFIDEIGDCFWYLTMLHVELNLPDMEVAQVPHNIVNLDTQAPIDQVAPVWREARVDGQAHWLVFVEDMAFGAFEQMATLALEIRSRHAHAAGNSSSYDMRAIRTGRIAGFLGQILGVMEVGYAQVLKGNIEKLHKRSIDGTIARDRA